MKEKLSVQLMGFRRGDGQIGVRNHVAVVSTVYCSTPVVNKIAKATGAVAVVHEGGCLELGPVQSHTERVLQGVIQHPNVAGVLVVGLGCEQIPAERLAHRAMGKPGRYLNIRDAGGTEAAVERGVELTRALLAEADEVKREPVDISELILATQCGGSDAGSGLASNPVVGTVADQFVDAGGTVLLGEPGNLYGAIGVILKRATSPAVGRRLIEITDAIEAYYNRMGKNFRMANPTPGNIAGGLTTLIEKSMGGVCKGGTAPIEGVLRPGEKVKGKGLWIMDTSLGVDTMATTDLVAGGAHIVAFTTGRGNPAGCPIAPVIKITAMRHTIETMGENIDFDASPVLSAVETRAQCGDRLFQLCMDVANGKLTRAEELRHGEFAIGRVALR